tara:strand:- start:313 stop:696 length:384 start_codon:yes stop_codon:yes gene_type:complete
MLRAASSARLCASAHARHLSRRANPTIASQSKRPAGNFKPTIRQAETAAQRAPPPKVETSQDAALPDTTVSLSSRERIIMWTCIASCTLAVVSFTLIKWDVEKRLDMLPVLDKKRWLAGEKVDKEPL